MVQPMYDTQSANSKSLTKLAALGVTILTSYKRSSSVSTRFTRENAVHIQRINFCGVKLKKVQNMHVCIVKAARAVKQYLPIYF